MPVHRAIARPLFVLAVLAGLAANAQNVVADYQFQPDNYSLVLLAEFDQTTLVSKLIDFKNLTSDNGLYTNNGALSFFDNLAATGGILNVVPGDYVQIVLTRDGASDLVTAYTDGVQAFSFTDTTDLAVIDDPNSPNEFLHFFIDDGMTTHSRAGRNRPATACRYGRPATPGRVTRTRPPVSFGAASKQGTHAAATKRICRRRAFLR